MFLAGSISLKAQRASPKDITRSRLSGDSALLARHPSAHWALSWPSAQGCVTITTQLYFQGVGLEVSRVLRSR